MDYNTMNATVKGTTCEGEPFTESLTFTLVPPHRQQALRHRYYMTVKTSTQTLLIDVRYERTTDIEILADRWIKGYYGENAQDIIKQF